MSNPVASPIGCSLRARLLSLGRPAEHWVAIFLFRSISVILTASSFVEPSIALNIFTHLVAVDVVPCWYRAGRGLSRRCSIQQLRGASARLIHPVSLHIVTPPLFTQSADGDDSDLSPSHNHSLHPGPDCHLSNVQSHCDRRENKRWLLRWSGSSSDVFCRRFAAKNCF